MMFARLQPNPQQPGTRFAKAVNYFTFLSLLCVVPFSAAQEIGGKDPAAKTCQATLELSYLQRNTVAEVDGTIENPMCAASSGDYELGVTIKEASGGDPKVLEFSGQWQRSDNQPVRFSVKYPIGENVELIRVKTRKIHCRCD